MEGAGERANGENKKKVGPINTNPNEAWSRATQRSRHQPASQPAGVHEAFRDIASFFLPPTVRYKKGHFAIPSGQWILHNKQTKQQLQQKLNYSHTNISKQFV